MQILCKFMQILCKFMQMYKHLCGVVYVNIRKFNTIFSNLFKFMPFFLLTIYFILLLRFFLLK